MNLFEMQAIAGGVSRETPLVTSLSTVMFVSKWMVG